MKIAVYISIDEEDYIRHNIISTLPTAIRKVLDRCYGSKAELIIHPIVYRDEESEEYNIK